MKLIAVKQPSGAESQQSASHSISMVGHVTQILAHQRGQLKVMTGDNQIIETAEPAS